MSEPDDPRTAQSGADAAPPGGAASFPHDGPEPPAGAHRPRHRLWLRVLVAVIVVVAVGCAIADNVDLGEYVITPGVAQPVGRLVTVPRAVSHPVHGAILLADVFVSRVTALSYLFDTWRADAQILPAETLLGPATPASELVSQGYLEMAQSQSAAKAAALTRLGYDVHAHEAGTVIYSVVQGSPAWKRLAVGQIVTAVDGQATPNACAFAQALASHRANDRIQLTVERSHVDARAAVVPGPVAHETLRLARWPASVPRPSTTPSCPGIGSKSQGFLGVEAETQVDFADPVHVSVRTTSIGGPSAGLAMTLAIIDELSSGRVTGGRTVAATGTIAPTGAVGTVGGIPEKTIAVERAGATVFFVPAAQVATARRKATPSLRVFGVRTLTQALSDLASLGGTVPPTPARHGS